MNAADTEVRVHPATATGSGELVLRQRRLTQQFAKAALAQRLGAQIDPLAIWRLISQTAGALRLGGPAPIRLEEPAIYQTLLPPTAAAHDAATAHAEAVSKLGVAFEAWQADPEGPGALAAILQAVDRADDSAELLAAALDSEDESANAGESAPPAQTEALLALRISNRALAVLSECNEALVRASSEQELLTTVCEIIVNVGGYRMAWVGMALDDPDRSVRPVAQMGYEAGYLERARISWADTEQGQGPTGVAIRENRVTTARFTDANFAPWRAQSIERGYAASAAIPLRKEGQVIGALNIYSPDLAAFSSPELELLEQLGDDLAYGVVALRTALEHRESVQRHALLAMAMDQTDDTVIITNTNSVIQYVNQAFTTASGYSRAEVMGQHVGVLRSGEHDAAFYDTMWRVLNQGDAWTGQFTNRRKDGSIYTEKATISPVHDEHGERTHFVAVKHDISEKTQLEAQLQQAVKMDAIGRLAAGVAHDFNNILTVILTSCDFLGEDLHAADPVLADVKSIQEASIRAQALTGQLLAFSRKQPTKTETLDINEIARSMLSMLQRLIGEDIDLRLELSDTLAWVRMDVSHLEQVVLNLVVNSKDAMPMGGQLLISTTRLVDCPLPEWSGPTVCLAIKDSGHGMDAPTQTRVFEPFFTTKASDQGTGLGLATVYGIVKQSGGSICVKSAIGEGTTFRILLPAAEAPSLERSPTVAPQRRGGQGETILVVEDQSMVRTHARRILERAGYTVLEAAHGADALALASDLSVPIDLLFTDVVMPTMSGTDLVDQLHTLRPELRVIFTSGYTDTRLTQHGVLDDQVLVRKPYTAAILKDAVRTALGGLGGRWTEAET